MGENARRRLLLCGSFGMGMAAAALSASGADYEVIASDDYAPPPHHGLRGRDDLGASGPPLSVIEPGGRRRRSGLSPADRLMARSRDRARRAR